jgi:hypothetical protein
LAQCAAQVIKMGPEAILFCIDTDPELGREATTGSHAASTARNLTRLDVLKQSIMTIAAAKVSFAGDCASSA